MKYLLILLIFISVWYLTYASPVRGDTFRRLDSDDDGFITLKDLFHLHYWHNEISKVYFAEMDTNDDGNLSWAEFEDYRSKWAEQEVVKARKRSEYLAKKAMDKYDSESSGNVDLQEVKKYFEEERLEFSPIIPDVLALFDKDKNKRWSREELQEFFYFYLPPKRHTESPDETFNRIDKNEDGYIDFNDYIRRDPVYEAEIKSLFQKMDADNDAYLTRDEFGRFELHQIII